jgi:DNA-binding MarR family transcriptional regulator
MIKQTVFDLIERMAALIRSEERKKCTECGLQLVHFQALDYLSRCNKYSDSPASIANYLGMTRGTVSQTLLLLEKKGYIKKTQDLVDRRVIHISLLPEGTKILELATPVDLFDKAYRLLQSEDLQQIDATLSHVLYTLQKSNNSYTFGICKTCRFFTHLDKGYQCGLTKETLLESDSQKICQEHAVI